MRTLETKDRAAAFLYLLMRDHVTPGKVEQILEELQSAPATLILSNGFLAEHAVEVAKKLARGGHTGNGRRTVR